MIPNRYQQSTGNLVNYDYSDIASGTGYKIFYAYNERLSGSVVNYRLDSNPIYSYDIETSGASAVAYTIVKDLDFDVLFNKPQNIKGDIKFIIPVRAGGGGSPYVYFIVYVMKWDGATETILATCQSPELEAVTLPKTISMSANVAKTHFKSGEYLRVTVQMVAKSNPASTFAVFHDPMNRDGWGVTVGTTIATTKLQVHVPFVMDL